MIERIIVALRGGELIDISGENINTDNKALPKLDLYLCLRIAEMHEMYQGCKDITDLKSKVERISTVNGMRTFKDLIEKVVNRKRNTVKARWTKNNVLHLVCENTENISGYCETVDECMKARGVFTCEKEIFVLLPSKRSEQ